jgi:deoxycytidylate deaminase
MKINDIGEYIRRSTWCHLEQFYKNANKTKTNIPTWEEYFLKLASEAAKRSKDAQTQCGCIITDPNHHVLATGYNSFVRGLDDSQMPNVRPGKYKWMRHAEINALDNRTTNFWQYPNGVIAYVTSRPCFNCMQSMWANNVTTVYYGDYSAPKMCEGETEDEKDFNLLINMIPIQVYEVKRDS